MKMETFDEILRRNVKIPKGYADTDSNMTLKVKCFTKRWVQARKVKHFTKRWAQTRKLYNEYCSFLSERNDHWASFNTLLLSNWGVSVSLEEFEPLAYFDFHTPKEAMLKIDAEISTMSRKKLSTLYFKIDEVERKKWIEQIVANHSDASLIVIKDNSYNPSKVLAKFNENVAKKVSDSIIINPLLVIWVCFNPKDYDLTNWGMCKNSSSVEYIY